MTPLKSICSFFLTMLAVFLQAQPPGEIAVEVRDKDGYFLPNSKVSLTDSMGVEMGRAAVIDPHGSFSLRPLSPGIYNIVISSKDCPSQIQRGVIVSAEKSTVINVHLDCVPPQKKSRKRQRKF